MFKSRQPGKHVYCKCFCCLFFWMVLVFQGQTSWVASWDVKSRKQGPPGAPKTGEAPEAKASLNVG